MISPVTTILFEKKDFSERMPEVKIHIELQEIQQFQLRQFIPKIRPMNEQKYAQFSKRFNRGDRCFVAFSEGVPCHFSWVRMLGVMAISSANKSFSLDTNQSWIFDCRTNESYRGLSIYPQVISRISNDLLENGMTSVMIDATKDNSASVNGILKAGFIPVKQIWRWASFIWSKKLN